jgi:hypothetical protein
VTEFNVDIPAAKGLAMKKDVPVEYNFFKLAAEMGEILMLNAPASIPGLDMIVDVGATDTITSCDHQT